MPPIGETLREARTRQGIELSEVEQATKIRAKYLRALEAEDFDRLPGATFVRTFLRTYAEYLGLDAHLLVEEFRAGHEPARDEEAAALGPPPPSRPRQRESRLRPAGTPGGPGRAPIMVGALVAIVAVLLLIGLLSGGDGEDEAGSAGPQQGQQQGQGNANRNQGGGGQQNRRGGNQGVRLRVVPLGETYVCVVDSGGDEVFEQTIAEPETFEDDESLSVNLGNTQVELRLNGDDVGIDQGSNPVGLEFTAEGEEELPESERPCT